MYCEFILLFLQNLLWVYFNITVEFTVSFLILLQNVLRVYITISAEFTVSLFYYYCRIYCEFILILLQNLQWVF